MAAVIKSLESLRVAITETHEGRKGVASRSPVSDSTSVRDEKKGERKIQSNPTHIVVGAHNFKPRGTATAAVRRPVGLTGH